MDFAILIARQRSGTGALGSILDKHPDLKYLGEIFHPDNIGNEANFFTFLLERVKDDPRAALPDAQYDIFEQFLERMSDRWNGKKLVVDIKYRSLHHLNGGWRGLFEAPVALARTMAKKKAVLHLTRKNSVASYVSGRLAEENKVWHAREGDAVSVRSVVLNIRDLSKYIVSSEREANQVEQWTGHYGKLAAFDYDDMFDAEGLLAANIVARLEKVLEITPFKDRSSVFVKQAPARMAESIENFDLVKEALAGSGNEWMLS